MTGAWTILLAFALAFAILWAAGSLTLLTMRPWRHFDRDDRWLAWALIFGWPFILGAMAIEIAIERRLDRRDARAGHVR